MDEPATTRQAARDRLMRQFDAATDKRAFVRALLDALLPLCDVSSLRAFVEAQHAKHQRP